MSGEGNLPHIPGFIIKVSSLLFSEIKNTHLEGKELGRIQHSVQVFLYHALTATAGCLFLLLRSIKSKKTTRCQLLQMALSSCLPSRLKHWPRLCPRCCSSTPQRCRRCPCSCAPRLRSETTKNMSDSSGISPVPLPQIRPDAYRGVPDVDTLVEGAASQVLAVGAEGHTVDGFLVLGQRVNANPSLDVPQAHRRVERGAAWERGSRLWSGRIKWDTQCRGVRQIIHVMGPNTWTV